MKRIGIDARLYFQTGVGVYLRNFLHYLQLAAPSYEFYIYVMKEDSAKIELNGSKFIKKEVTARWHTLAEQTIFLQELISDDLDLMHFTYFSYPVLYKRKFIATVHDVTPLLFKTGKASTKNPLLFEFKHKAFEFVLSTQVHSAAKIITPTKTVKMQLVDVYGYSIENKTQHVYEGVNFELVEAKEDMTLQAAYTKPFFIYVGNFYPHKNVNKLVEAFHGMSADVQLVLIGPENYFSKRLKSQVKNANIRFHHNVSNGQLKYFYKNAEALINPSLSEGFGLPIVEAAHFDLPVIASNLDVFKELLGDNYLSFDPESVEDIKGKIESFMSKKSKPNYADLMKKYSFEEMTKQIISVYASILSR